MSDMQITRPLHMHEKPGDGTDPLQKPI